MANWHLELMCKGVLALVLLLAVGGCNDKLTSSLTDPVQHHIARNDWQKAVRHYRKKLQAQPDDPRTRAAFLTVTENAVYHYLHTAQDFDARGDEQAAYATISKGLLIVPESTILRNELTRLEKTKKAQRHYEDAVVAQRQNRSKKARQLAEKALKADPKHTKAAVLLNEIIAENLKVTSVVPIRLNSAAPVTINFRQASFKDAVVSLGQTYGLNTIFDSDLQDRDVTIYAEEIPFEQAFNLLLKASGATYKRLSGNSAIIFADTDEKSAEYNLYHVRTYFLNSADAAVMADLLTRTFGLVNISVNTTSNSMTVRDTPERLALVDKLIDVNDRLPAEVVLEVEILEVNRTKTENLGIDFGSQITVTPPGMLVADVQNNFGSTLQTSSVALPAMTLRYLKQDVDATTLASPRIRTLDEREATIHIGDRVPLRASTVQDATGQTRTTFEYKDVGIKLQVLPNVRLNKSVAVKLQLEVSALGQNLGTTAEPAYSIGTRKFETEMVLPNGGTAIIGGLIRDEERNNKREVPGLGRIPLIGKLFKNRESTGTRTDILLTLTPRVVRGWELPAPSDAQFVSGTGNRAGSKAPFAFMAAKSAAKGPTIRLDLSGDGRNRTSQAVNQQLASLNIAPIAADQSTRDTGSRLAFDKPLYQVSPTKTLALQLTAQSAEQSIRGAGVIRFKSDLVRVVSAEAVGNADVEFKIRNEKGEIHFEIKEIPKGPASQAFADVKLEGVSPGISYLIYARKGLAGSSLPKEIAFGSSRVQIR